MTGIGESYPDPLVEGVVADTPESISFINRVLMFTDIEGSSTRWDNEADMMRALMRHHDAVVSEAVENNGGTLGARTGDGAIALFETAVSAARAACDLQTRIVEGPRSESVSTGPLRVRIGLHRGVVEPRGGEHYGPPMHRTARIMSAGHGGQIVVSAAVAEELRIHPAEGFVLVDRGMHRLKGFHEPERLNELVRDGMSPDPRGLRVAVSTGSLPAVDIDSLVGREGEIARIQPHVVSGRITTLVGTGGVGKTRLALQLGRLCMNAFPEGVWFVDLASVSGPDRVSAAVAETLGIAEESQSPADSVRQAMQTRDMLVILDNCEHVIDAVRSLVRTLACAPCAAAILATSQRALDVAGEHVEVVEPLDYGPALDGSPAANMFLRAAQHADPHFVVDSHDSEAIARICRRLDGLPLALELAAGRVRLMSVRQIADELETSFDLLRSRDQPERHRTMFAAISWSVSLLSEDDRTVLIDLSVFKGDFTWEAAAAVTGRNRFDIADSLEELVRRSLLVRRGEGLRMLVPLQNFCGVELGDSKRDLDVKARHASWVQSTIPVPLDDTDPTTVALRLDRVRDATEDIHSAHAWLIAHDPVQAAHLALSLVEAWIARGRSNDAVKMLSACDTDATPAPMRIEILGWFAAHAWTVGRNEEGEAAAVRSLALAEANGLPLPVLAAVRLAVRYAFSNRGEQARELTNRIEHEVRSKQGDGSRPFPPLGVVLAVVGEVQRGVTLVDEGIAAARKVGAIRLLSALTNRILLQPGTEEVAMITHEVEVLASVLGRTSAQAHAIAAIAQRARKQGDLVGFLEGVARFSDLMIVDEPTAVVQMMQWVPSATAPLLPRDATVMLAALESLAEIHDQRGTEQERARRGAIHDVLLKELGDQEFDRAWSEGSALRLGEAVDRLHWMVETCATRLDK